MRLACIYALLDSSNLVKSQHLVAALALWTHSERSAEFIFGELRGDPDVDKTIEALKQTGRLTITDIHNLFGRHADRGEVERVVRELLKHPNIARETVNDTGGAPVTILIWDAKQAN